MGLLERIERQKALQPQNTVLEAASFSNKGGNAYVDEYFDLKDKIHGEIIELINQDVFSRGKTEEFKEEYIRQSIETLVDENGNTIPRSDRVRLVKEIFNNVVGLGPLEPLLEDPEITEIMVSSFMMSFSRVVAVVW